MSENSTITNLRKLTREAPRQEALQKVFSELKTGQSDRAVALIAGAMVENSLQGLVEDHLIELSEGERKDIFNSGGPLSSFSALIKVAYAMGLLPKEARRDLDIMREIRNVFAHARLEISFDTPQVSAACSQLSSFDKLPAFFDDMKGGNNRTCYINHAMYYCVTMLEVSVEKLLGKVAYDKQFGKTPSGQKQGSISIEPIDESPEKSAP